MKRLAESLGAMDAAGCCSGAFGWEKPSLQGHRQKKKG